jgi:signal transduction histidine kinase
MKRNSILICTILSLVLWAATAYVYVSGRSALTPQSLLSDLQRDLNQKERSVNAILNNETLLRRIWSNSLSEADLVRLQGEDLLFRVYDSTGLIFWSRNDFPANYLLFQPDLVSVQEPDVFYLYRSYGNRLYPSRRLNVVIPVYQSFTISNEYLRSGFWGVPGLPASTQLSLTPKEGFAALKSLSGRTLFYASVNPVDISPYVPGWLLISLCLAAILLSIVSLHLLALHLSRIYSAWTGIGLVAFSVLLIALLVYWLGLPFQLSNLDLFSPQLYASSSFLPSFGHLLLHVCCLFWLFYFVNAISATADIKRTIASISKPMKWAIVVIIVAGAAFIGTYVQYLHRSMVFDSDIFFSTDKVHINDKMTMLSLLVCVLMARMLMYVIHIGNYFLGPLLPNRKVKLLVVFIIGSLSIVLNFVLVLRNHQWLYLNNLQFWFDIFAVIWSLGYIIFLDSKYAKGQFGTSGLFTLIFVSVYFSVLFALCFKLFIDQKEQSITRLAFAERLSRMQDTELEMKFGEVSEKIAADAQVKQWLLEDDTIRVSDVYKHFKLSNAEIYFPRYDLDVYLFDAGGRSLIRDEVMSLDSIFRKKQSSAPTLNSTLFFKADSTSRGTYLALVPVRDERTKMILGYFAADFRLKQNIVLSLYPRLLLDRSNYISDKEEQYDYAIYYKGRLANRAGNFHFNYALPELRFRAPYLLRQQGSYSVLYYKAGKDLVYMVVYQNNLLAGVLTMFSFLFAIFLLLSTLENWAKLLAKDWFFRRKVKLIYNASMSVRVKYFALGFTAVSFFVIGLSTIIFLTNRYQSSSREQLQNSIVNISEAVNDYVSNQKIVAGNRSLETALENNDDFAYFLTSIAQQQKIDINIFGTGGKLAFSTQEKVYRERIFEPLMAPMAFLELQRKRATDFIQQEQVGSLNYTAGYARLTDDRGKIIGFLNIPSFYTKQQLNEQILSLITTLLNIYTILLLISSVITFLFIDTLTRSLNLVASKLKNVNLKSNELIHWPYEDEIGLLVSEYNKMVATVEQNARSLVLDERQSAWREMAQQVAHEIKNPLTPMKLNIQYLQQAINSNHPDIINLTKRVSSSIIEQIDNLNYIASEFSNFAKMPENKTERIDIKSMLERIILLFAGNRDLTITHSFPEGQVIVFADHSQMLRIFTNIVQNAAEALAPPEERHGEINISLRFTDNLEGISVVVKDNGSGIPESVKDKIFDPYFTTKSSGTGLGLAMTKKIIELWGGSIRFESEANVGTTFYIELPLG